MTDSDQQGSERVDVDRQTEHGPANRELVGDQRKAERRAGIALAVAIVAGVGLFVVYFAGGQTQIEGLLFAVAFGAFGAHGLRDMLDSAALGWWQTAVTYLLPHAVAVVALGLTARPRLVLPGWLLAFGAALFAGTLFAMALGAPRWFGAITPLGGTAMIVGWLLLAWRASRQG